MGDVDWRAAERRWRAAPADGGLFEQAAQARRRAGLGVPAPWHEAVVFPARTFASELPLQVYVRQPDKVVRLLGETPGVVEIPPSRLWWVKPKGAKWLPGLVREAHDQAIPGLGFSYVRLTNDHVAELAELEHLIYLALEAVSPKVGDPGLRHLTRLGRLQVLDLSRSKGWTAKALAPFAALPDLIELNLHNCLQLDDDDLAAVAGLPRLSRLCLEGLKIRGPGLAHLAPLTQLRHLDLVSCHALLTGGVSHLPPLPQLEELLLNSAGRIHDGSLPGVASQRGLRALDVWATRITTAGLLAVLPQLPDLVQLRPSHDHDQVALQAALPRCNLVGPVGIGWPCLRRREGLRQV
jgi:hypothetical protein